MANGPVITRRKVLALAPAAALAGPFSILSRTASAQSTSAQSTSAQPAGDVADEPSQVFDLGMDQSERMTVPVKIGGQGPFSFIVDTASERTVVARELAERLSLRAGSDIAVHTLTGKVETKTARLPEFGIQGYRLAPREAALFAARNIGAMGVLGLDALKSQRVLLDFKVATMAMNIDPRLEDDWQGESILVTAHSRLGQLIITSAGLGARDDGISVIVDTGSQVSVGNQALKQFLQKSNALAQFGSTTLVSITGEATPVEYIVLKGLRVGGLNISNLPIAFSDVHPFRRLGLIKDRALFLGMDVLRAFDQVALDFQKKRVKFFWHKT